MQGNATEIDERNLLQLDALLSHGYGLSPQLVMRSKGLSIEAKALYGYLSSFAGAGDTAFPSTSRILEELDISKKERNRFCLAGGYTAPSPQLRSEPPVVSTQSRLSRGFACH